MRVTDSEPDLPAPLANPSGPAAPAMSFLRLRQAELAWLALWLACVLAIAAFPRWQLIPIDAMWISLALLHGFRLWPSRGLLALTMVAVATTAAALIDDMAAHRVMVESIAQIPLLATIIIVMAWQAHRRMVAGERAGIAAEAQRLLKVQRQFLQDASHQLRTPITIALGHAELLAAELAGRQQQRDIHVVVGELERLRTLSDRLLLIAASENPDFLTLEMTDLDLLAVELMRRWQPMAPRRWQLGRLDQVRALVDAERLAMALDALVENAVRHTGQDDLIRLTIRHDDSDRFARIAIEDSGEGIAAEDLPHIFKRFRTMTQGCARGTGLGLALVEAIARGHGGAASVQSMLGHGSRFELAIPAAFDGPEFGEPGCVMRREAF
ncbi:MAG TPA: HAMP domain-containing sensor histidine kinase [Streptosporangiaceae bacterium]|nr:HAMP domain-containing sensor histidine kinase [Streptosporangiaceae bacterium]